MNKNLLVFLLGLAPLASAAEVISEEQAMDIAAQFFNKEGNKTSRSTSLPLKMVWNGQSKTGRTVSSEAPAFYVFNRGEHQGFVIVSGEDAALPILAYSNTGSFEVENMPVNIQGWAAQRTEEIAYLRQQAVKADVDFNESWLKAVQEGEQFVLNTPSWNQEEPYNKLTPSNKPTGCAATAVATVMGFYQWPDCGVGTIPSYSYTDNYGQSQFVDAITLGDVYDYSIMPSINGNSLDFSNEASGLAVSKLMFHIGAMIKSKYDWYATGAYTSDIAEPVVKYMKYQKGLKCLDAINFYFDRWTDIMFEEVRTGHPVFYSGYTASGQGGHAFVLDGCDNNQLFHVNWGWGGQSDGFYSLTSLAPQNQGAGGTPGASFSYNNYAFIGMRPSRDGQQDPAFDAFEFVKYGKYPVGLSAELPTPVQKGSSFYVKGGRIINMGNCDLTTKFCLAHTDRYGNVKDYLYTPDAPKTVIPGDPSFSFWDTNMGDSYTLVTIKQDVAPGDRIRLVYTSVDGTVKPVVSDTKRGQWELILRETDAAAESLQVTTTAGNNLPGHAVATFSAEWATSTTQPGVEAFYAEMKDQHTITLKKIEPNGGELVIPAHTGVVLSTPTATRFTMEPATQHGAFVPGSNLLKPTSAQGITVDKAVNAYILSKKLGEVLFHVLSTTYRDIAANRAYLALSNDLQMASVKMVFDDEATGIEDTFMDEQKDAPIFDLFGRRVMSPVKGGIYIQNGKKFMK